MYMVEGWGSHLFQSYQTGGGRVAQWTPPIDHKICLHSGIIYIVALCVPVPSQEPVTQWLFFVYVLHICFIGFFFI